MKNLKKRLLALMGANPFGFEIAECEMSEGVSQELIWGLWQICCLFSGCFCLRTGALLFALNEIVLRLEAPLGGTPCLRIYRPEIVVKAKDFRLISLSNGITVACEASITGDELQQWVLDVDTVAEQEGFVVNEARQMVEVMRVAVDSVLQTSTDWVPVPGVSDDEYLECLSDPHLVKILQIEGARILAYASHAAEVEAMMRERIKETIEDIGDAQRFVGGRAELVNLSSGLLLHGEIARITIEHAALVISWKWLAQANYFKEPKEWIAQVPESLAINLVTRRVMSMVPGEDTTNTLLIADGYMEGDKFLFYTKGCSSRALSPKEVRGLSL